MNCRLCFKEDADGPDNNNLMTWNEPAFKIPIRHLSNQHNFHILGCHWTSILNNIKTQNLQANL